MITIFEMHVYDIQGNQHRYYIDKKTHATIKHTITAGITNIGKMHISVKSKMYIDNDVNKQVPSFQSYRNCYIDTNVSTVISKLTNDIVLSGRGNYSTTHIRLKKMITETELKQIIKDIKKALLSKNQDIINGCLTQHVRYSGMSIVLHNETAKKLSDMLLEQLGGE